MSNYNSIKATINANIKANGNQEITGPVLQSVLNAMVTSLGAGYEYQGVATPTTNPGSPDAKLVYIASQPGTYTYFGGIIVKAGEVAILRWDTTWHKDVPGLASALQIQELPLNMANKGIVSTWDNTNSVSNNYVSLYQGHKYQFEITFANAGTLGAAANLKLMSPSSYTSVKTIISLANRSVSAGEVVTTEMVWTDASVLNYRLGFYEAVASGRSVITGSEVSIRDITMDVVLTDVSNAVMYVTQTKSILERDKARFNVGALSAETIRNSLDYNISYYTSTLFNANVNNSTHKIESSSTRFLSFRKVSKGDVYAIVAHNPITTSNWFVLWMADTRPAIGHTDLTMQTAREMGSTGVYDFVIEWEAPQDGWLVVAAQKSANSYYTLYEKVKSPNIFNYASQKIPVPRIVAQQAIDADPDSPTFGQPVSHSNTYFGISDYIDVEGAYCISVGVIYNTANIFQGASLGGVFYDANKNPIAPYNICNYSPTNASGRHIVLVPEGTKYIRTTTWPGTTIYLFREAMSEVVDNARPYFSSFIPFRESYENYMTIQEAQGATIYGNYLFAWHTGNVLNVYDMTTKTQVQQIALPTFPNTRTHANTISFGKQKYSSSDPFPVMYLCSGYTTADGNPDSQVYVLRFTGSIGSLSASLVQTITLSFGGWTEFVVDPIKDVAWINGSGIATYICVAVPSVTAGDVTFTTSVTIIDKFDTPPIRMGVSTTSSGQGRFFYHGRVFFVSGVPQYSGEGEDALYLVVDNTLTHSRESVVALKNYGLANGSDIAYEPEACFVWNNDFYVVYRTFLAKLIQ